MKPGPSAFPMPARFWSYIEPGRADDECWEWDGARLSNGYGSFALDGRTWLAHCMAYTLAVGPVPVGLELDHLCRNPACVNPAHLEPVTHAENVRRGARKINMTHCKQGHEFTAENTYQTDRQRYCLTCKRAAGRRYWAQLVADAQ